MLIRKKKLKKATKKISVHSPFAASISINNKRLHKAKNSCRQSDQMAVILLEVNWNVSGLIVHISRTTFEITPVRYEKINLSTEPSTKTSAYLHIFHYQLLRNISKGFVLKDSPVRFDDTPSQDFSWLWKDSI